MRGLRLSQKFVPGREPLVVGASGGRDQRPAARRAGRRWRRAGAGCAPASQGPRCPGRRGGRTSRPIREAPRGPRTERSWRALGTEREPRGCGAQPARPASRDTRAGPRSPRSRSAAPRGPERAAGRAPKAGVSPKRGFGQNP